MLRSVIARLKQDLVVQGKEQSITAATSVALMQKLHQLAGGTIKFDSIDGKSLSKTLDYSKVDVIADRFASQQIVIFYQYCQELEALKDRLGDRVTTDLAEFNATDKSIALQIVSGREGINLSKASAIVFYNLSFSATSYWQARDRMTTIDRAESKVYWLFSENGIEGKIYAAVSRKKDYTVRAFKKDFGVKNPVKNRISAAA
jgi:ERCC4-related helicase